MSPAEEIDVDGVTVRITNRDNVFFPELGEQIYQKRVPENHPDYLTTCRVTFPSGRTADALMVSHPSAIVWAAQMCAITVHP